MAKTVVAMYDEITDVQNVVGELDRRGFPREKISVVTKDTRPEAREVVEDEGTHAGEGAGIGAAAGAVLGGIAGLLVDLGLLLIPGIGPLLVAGPIAVALTGAGVGAGTGAIVGALVGLGIPEEEARYYSEGIRRGGTLIAVEAPDADVDRAEKILQRFGPVDINERAASWDTT
jgi:hypothetical protein